MGRLPVTETSLDMKGSIPKLNVVHDPVHPWITPHKYAVNRWSVPSAPAAKAMAPMKALVRIRSRREGMRLFAKQVRAHA